MSGDVGSEFRGRDEIMALLESMKSEDTYAGGNALADQFLDRLKRIPEWFKSCVLRLGEGVDEDVKDFCLTHCGSPDVLVLAIPRDQDMTDIASAHGSESRSRAFSVGSIMTIGKTGTRDNKIALLIEPFRLTFVPSHGAERFTIRPSDIVSVSLQREVPSYLDKRQRAIVSNWPVGREQSYYT